MNIQSIPPEKRKRFIFTMFYAVSTVLTFWIVIIVWMLAAFQVLSPAATWVDGGFIKPISYAGETVEVFREIEVHRDVSTVISRAMIRSVNGSKHVYALPTFNMVYAKGSYKQLRLWQIPESLPAGDYNLHNEACYQELGFFERCIKLPLLPVTIVEK